MAHFISQSNKNIENQRESCMSKSALTHLFVGNSYAQKACFSCLTIFICVVVKFGDTFASLLLCFGRVIHSIWTYCNKGKPTESTKRVNNTFSRCGVKCLTDLQYRASTHIHLKIYAAIQFWQHFCFKIFTVDGVWSYVSKKRKNKVGRRISFFVTVNFNFLYIYI